MLRSLATIAATVPALLLGGCLADKNSDAPMVVLGNTALTSTSTDCAFTGLTGQPIMTHGIISTLSPSGYYFAPLIESKITALQGQELQRTINVEGADVTLSVPTASLTSATGSTTSLNLSLSGGDASFQALASGTVPPNNGTANIPMQLISETAIQSLVSQAKPAPTDHFSAEVVANVKLFGTLGGSRVEGIPFQYAVTVCNDCLVNVIGTCPVAGTARKGDPCNPYQDLPVDCCTEGNALVCPAPNM